MNSSHPTTNAHARHQGPNLHVHHSPGPHHALQDYPELEPVLTAAVNAAVASFYPEKIDAAVRAYLDRVTTAATLAIYAPIAAHAAQAARGAEDSRAAQTRAVAQAAAKITTHVTEAAADLQARAAASAAIIAQDVAAADLVAASPTPDEDATVLAAAEVAAAVHTAAAAADLERARAAAIVAQAATEAADVVAAVAEREAASVQLQIVESDTTARGLWLEACFRFATTFAGSAAEAVLADGMPGEVTDDPPPLVLADWVIYEACRPLTIC